MKNKGYGNWSSEKSLAVTLRSHLKMLCRRKSKQAVKTSFSVLICSIKEGAFSVLWIVHRRPYGEKKETLKV